MKLEIVDSLPDSEEEYEEHIALVMSSFFSVDYKKDDTKEEDTTATILATQDAASTAADVIGPKSPKAQIVPSSDTFDYCSDRRKKLVLRSLRQQMIRAKDPQRSKRPRRILKITHHLAKGLLIKNSGAENIEFIKL